MSKKHKELGDSSEKLQAAELNQNDDHEQEELLLETRISEQLILEHPTYKELANQLTAEEEKSQKHHNDWLLAQADLNNLKKRAEKDIAAAHKYALEKFAYEILSTVDNLERSLATKTTDDASLKDFYDGIELTLKSLLEVLQKFAITPIDPQNEDFDPEKHTAVSTKEHADKKTNQILEVIQKGYWLKDRLLRPALVVVVK